MDIIRASLGTVWTWHALYSLYFRHIIIYSQLTRYIFRNKHIQIVTVVF